MAAVPAHPPLDQAAPAPDRRVGDPPVAGRLPVHQQPQPVGPAQVAVIVDLVVLADAVEAHLLGQQHLVPDLLVGGGVVLGEVDVLVGDVLRVHRAHQVDRLTVEADVDAVDVDRAHAELPGGGVQGPFPLLEDRVQPVELRILDRPRPRIVDGEGGGDFHRERSVAGRQDQLLNRGVLRAVRAVRPQVQPHGPRRRVRGRGDADPEIGPPGLQIGGDEQVVEVGGAGHFHPYRPPDAAPMRAGGLVPRDLQLILRHRRPDRDPVGPVEGDQVGDVHRERQIAVLVGACEPAVHPHRGVVVDTGEDQRDPPAGVLGRDGELPLVPHRPPVVAEIVE